MKAKNKIKRLKDRQYTWDNMRSDGGDGKKKKKINKSEFTRPGSLNR